MKIKFLSSESSYFVKYNTIQIIIKFLLSCINLF